MGNKNKELVSIIIPTYNSSNYLAESINSCLKQTYKKIEIIICDDGSTDGTESLVKTFLKKYPDKIQYFKLKHSGAHAIPRNIGIRASKGEYIAFLDSDDVMKKNRIKEQVGLIKKLGEVSILCTNASTIDENSEKVGDYFRNIKEGRLTLNILIKNNYIIQSTVLMKKSVISKIGYYFEEKKGYHPDYEYWLRASALKTRIYYIPKKLIYYRQHSNSISSKISTSQSVQKKIEFLKRIINMEILTKPEKKMFESQIRKDKLVLLIKSLKKYQPVYFFIKAVSFRVFYPLIYLFRWFKFNIFLKHKKELRLHLGCGGKYFKGYINIDYPPSYSTVQLKHRKVDFYCDITKLKLKNSSVDEIRLHHVFEHFTYPESLSLLVKWNKVLKSNGKLVIETPDIKTCFKELFLQKDFKKQAQILRHIFGSHEASWAIHKDGWYEEKYKFILNRLGFKINRIDFTEYKSTRNITVTANKKESFSDAEFNKRIKEILSFYLIDECETKLLNEWMSNIKLK